MKKKVLALLAVLFALGVVLTACAPSVSQSGLQSVELEEYEMLFGAEALASVSNHCVTESGLFYLKDGQMKYYEFASKQSYVLCGRANCRHKDESCPAYYDWEKINSVVGLAMVGDARYVVKRNEEENTYDLLQTDLYGEQQKVIYSLDIGDYQPGNWAVLEVSHVYYTQDMAWLTVIYQYMQESGSSISSQNGVIGVRLSDGEELYHSAMELNGGSYNIALLSADYAILQKEWDEVPQISEEEFYVAMGAGEYAEYSDNSNPYEAYYNDWFSGKRQPMYEFDLYDVASGQTTMMDSGEMRLFYSENGDLQGLATNRSYMGQCYDGRILYYEWGPNFSFDHGGSTDVYSWDPVTGDVKTILHMDNGYICTINSQGETYIELTNHGRQFYYYMPTEDNEEYMMYAYDLEMDESETLFSSDNPNKFNLWGETENTYFGSFDGMSFYLISKEEYRKGNFNAAEKLVL